MSIGKSSLNKDKRRLQKRLSKYRRTAIVDKTISDLVRQVPDELIEPGSPLENMKANVKLNDRKKAQEEEGRRVLKEMGLL